MSKLKFLVKFIIQHSKLKILIPLLIFLTSCILNPNAPANVYECNKNNVQGENLAKCKKEVKNLFQLALAALSLSGGGGHCQSHRIRLHRNAYR